MLPSNMILTSTNKVYCSLGGAAEVVRTVKELHPVLSLID
jgi:hypothetical protein